MEAEHTGKEHGRKLLHAGVELFRRAVEEAADCSQLVLDVGQLALQLQEVLVSLQVGISLHADLQTCQGTAQGILSLDLIIQGGCIHRSSTGCRHTLQHTLLVLGIPLDGIHQVRNKVVTLLQLNIDVGESVFTIVAQSHQIVIDTDNPKNQQHGDCYQDNCCCTHLFNCCLTITV